MLQNGSFLNVVMGIHDIIDPSSFSLATDAMLVCISNTLYRAWFSEVLNSISGLRGNVHGFRRVVRFHHDLLLDQDVL
jgi:hypothetical protein